MHPQAAVHVQDLAGHVGGAGAEQERDDGGDIGGLAEASQGDAEAVAGRAGGEFPI